MRRTVKIENFSLSKLITLSQHSRPFVLLNSNNESQLQRDVYGKYDLLAGIGAIDFIEDDGDFFSSLKRFHEKHKDWVFGYMTYDLKNQVEKLSSENFDGISAPLFRFFRPRYVITVRDNDSEIHYDETFDDEQSALHLTEKLTEFTPDFTANKLTEIKARTSKENYISTFEKIKRHIQLGDIYEMNYCIEFFANEAEIDPASVYMRLNQLSPMPFSAYMHSDDCYLMCASPERYLAKRGNKIISQPIKGTARRGTDEASDEIIKNELAKNPKEQSENVMIVDMVRNDLSRTAARGSVQVEELFGIKTFKQLHQMITTVVSELKDGVHFTDAIKASFPMGSMTGAPKVSSMNLIEEYEEVKRGLYSGSIGYVNPDGDFDFNVIIRSIIYNQKKKYLSYMTGSAITIGANAVQEYNECMLKAAAMEMALTNYELRITNYE